MLMGHQETWYCINIKFNVNTVPFYMFMFLYFNTTNCIIIQQVLYIDVAP